jgi:hypothetical protein
MDLEPAAGIVGPGLSGHAGSMVPSQAELTNTNRWMDFLTLNLPKSRRGLLLSLANSKISNSSEGRNPPSIVTDHDGNRLFGRDLQRTQGGRHVSPTHDSEAMRSTIQKSKLYTFRLPSPSLRGIYTETINSPLGIREPQTSDHNVKPWQQGVCIGSAERDFVTSMQSTVSGVGRTNQIFGAVPSHNDQTYRLRYLKHSSDAPMVAVQQISEEPDRFGSPSTPSTKPRSRGGENRVMLSSQGHWSTFFSEGDLQKQPLPYGKLASGATDPILLEDHTGNASPKSRTSSTFESKGIRTTMRWRPRDGPLRRPRLDASATPTARGPASPSSPRCCPARPHAPSPTTTPVRGPDSCAAAGTIPCPRLSSSIAPGPPTATPPAPSPVPQEPSTSCPSTCAAAGLLVINRGGWAPIRRADPRAGGCVRQLARSVVSTAGPLCWHIPEREREREPCAGTSRTPRPALHRCNRDAPRRAWRGLLVLFPLSLPLPLGAVAAAPAQARARRCPRATLGPPGPAATLGRAECDRPNTTKNRGRQ